MILEIIKNRAIRRIVGIVSNGSDIARITFSPPAPCFLETERFPKIRNLSRFSKTKYGPLYFTKSFKSSENELGSLDRVTFNNVCTETLDSLSDYFEELIESIPHLRNADVTYSDGVLTVHFGKKHGTYVINRQTPNLQIWLSSPTSGPKRYDFAEGTWVYKHDKTTLHSLLDEEIKEIANQEVEFVKKCIYGKAKS